MAYDEALAARIRSALDGEVVVEKKAFGGLAFMIAGNMAVSASGQGGLMLRCRPEDTESLLGEGVTRAEMRGRAMDGWLRADDPAIATDAALARLVAVGVDFAHSLPPNQRAGYASRPRG